VRTTDPVTTDELRQAFDRVPGMRFYGWTFEKAVGNDLIRWSLEKSALSFRNTHHLPAQPRLI
jgi:hypothetical protein